MKGTEGMVGVAWERVSEECSCVNGCGRRHGGLTGY